MTLLTAKEYNAIAGALRDPKFPSILNSYVWEVADPSNEVDRINYMLQLEADGQLPKRKSLIRPDPWICLETRLAGTCDDTRIFINLLSSNRVANVSRATMESRIHVPFILSDLQPCIMDDMLCTNIDAVVGIGTVHECVKAGIGMIVMVLNLIVDHLNSARLPAKGRLSKDFRWHREWRYRGNLPADRIVPVLTDASNLTETNREGNESVKRTCAASGIYSDSRHFLDTCNGSDDKERHKSQDGVLEEKTTTEARFDVTYITHGNDSCQSEELRVLVYLPGTVSSSEVSVDDTMDNEVTVKYRECLVRVPIKCKIDRSSGKAQFDKSNNNLSITWNLV